MVMTVTVILSSLVGFLDARYHNIRRPSAFFQMVQPTTYRPNPLVLTMFYDGVCDNACEKQRMKKQKHVAELVAKSLPQMDVLSVDCANDELYEIACKAGVSILPTFVLYKDGELVRAGCHVAQLAARNQTRCSDEKNAPLGQAQVIDFVNQHVGATLKKRIAEEVAYEEELDRIRASRPVIWGAPYGWWGPGCGGWWGGRCGWWW